MITEFILNTIFAGINALFSLLPSFTFPDPGQGSVALGVVYTMNRVFPVDALITIALAILAIRLALQVWDFALFVYHQFWGSD